MRLWNELNKQDDRTRALSVSALMCGVPSTGVLWIDRLRGRLCSAVLLSTGAAVATGLVGGGTAYAGSCNPGQIFAADVLYPTGETPRFVAIGDLNGDGVSDMVVANSGPPFSPLNDNVSVLLNNGDGTFTPDVLYSTGDFCASVAIGDLDGDGDNDLVAGNRDSDTVSVLLNNGDGTFAPDVAYAAGGGPQSVAIADLDGDGDNDVAVANLDVNANDITVLLNNGDGTLAPGVLYDVVGGPRSVAIGDLDGDGDNDLVAGGQSGFSGLTVLLNNGDATFATGVPFDTGVGPISVALGDLDNDGDLDIATANISNDDVSILLNAGNGTFGPAVGYVVGGTFSEPNSVAIGDLDGDGDNDLGVTATGGPFVNSFFVLPNNGDATFAPSVQYIVDNTPVNGAIGDLDGDSDLDVAAVNLNSDNVSVLLNQCGPPAPVIIAQPTPVVLLPVGGGITNLSVSATGAAPLTYQWFRDGEPLTDDEGISGATTPSLTINAVAEDIGEYDIVVSNAVGSVASDRAVIAVRLSGPGDIDSDGIVDAIDLGILLGAFGMLYP